MLVCLLWNQETRMASLIDLHMILSPVPDTVTVLVPQPVIHNRPCGQALCLEFPDHLILMQLGLQVHFQGLFQFLRPKLP